MSLARLNSRGQSGLEAYDVTVEVHLANGLPTFAITGLPAAAVRESKDRVRAALDTCGRAAPSRRITVHLGPADVPKEGGRFDLAIALAIVKADKTPRWAVDDVEFLGELALNGDLRPVTGVLPSVLAAREARRRLIIPSANADEAALIEGAEVYAARHLKDVLDHLDGIRALPRVVPKPAFSDLVSDGNDLADVRGHALPKRALEVAAAGGHSLLMVGPPGSGKSMLAERIKGLLPLLRPEEMLCTASIASVAGKPVPQTLLPPFRAPHHTASTAALVGGGPRPRPGEVSLAHHGVLFLDELPEFSRTALEALREPLETGVVRISRVREQITFPAEFQLLAAMNPCPCGYLGDGTDRCRCPASRLEQYRSKVSGPLLDRFDLHIEVPRASFAEITRSAVTDESAEVRRAVARSRARQLERAGRLNARLHGSGVWKTVVLKPAQRRVLKRAADRWQLSGRSVMRVLKVARTIADLAESEEVTKDHVAEALQLRRLDREA